MSASIRDTRTGLLRDRVVDGVVTVLARNEAVTFAKVAASAGVPERTVYRHFPTRAALMSAVFDWANERIGVDGARPTTRSDAVALVRRLFPGFDDLAPVINELLVTPEGRTARMVHNVDRQRAATALVRNEASGLDRRASRRVAASVQMLTSAATWQALRDVWGMNGREAAETATFAIDLIIEAAQARATEQKGHH